MFRKMSLEKEKRKMKILENKTLYLKDAELKFHLSICSMITLPN
jgi:hypothetical protein